jgi:hypothetical protein
VEDIFDADIGSLKGKQVQLNPDAVHPYVPEMPTYIYERFKAVTVAVDIMYVNKISFFVSISRDIHFCTSEMLDNLKIQTILRALRHVANIYKTWEY